MNKITVITAITAGRDKLRNQIVFPDTEYLAFTDQKNDLWKTKKPIDIFKDSIRNAKIYKILSHKFCDSPYIIWMDGNCSLKKDPHYLIDILGENDFAFFKHPTRDCIYDEYFACQQQGRGNKELDEQIKDYKEKGFPQHVGLYEIACFIRKNNPKTNSIFESWWTEICKYSSRDQISLPIIFMGHKLSIIPGSIFQDNNNPSFPGNEFFKYNEHIK